MKRTSAADRHAPSLQSRIIFTMMAVILVVFAIHAFYMYSTQRAALIKAMYLNVNETLQRLSENIAPFMEAYSVNEYQKLVSTEIALTNHFAITVQDYEMEDIVGETYHSGQILTGVDSYAPYPQGNSEVTQRLNQAFYTNTAPIHASNGEVIGEVSVYESDEALVAQLKKLLIEGLIVVLVLAVTLSLLLATVLRRYFTQSISYLNFAMKKCDSDGIPREPVPDFPYREISTLSHTINTMLASIRESKEKRNIERLRLQNAITGTRTGTWEWNVSTGETVFNERWAEIIGYSLKELEPISIETWTSLAHPDDVKRSGELLNKHFQGELPYYECEARMLHKDGHWVWVLDRGSVLSWSDDGQPLMMYGTHQDISARKEAENKLSMAAGVFKYAREGILITSAEGVILDVNAAFSLLTGYASSDVTKQNYMFLASDRNSPDFFKTMLKSLYEEGVWRGECWMRRRNGSTFPSLLTIAAVRNRSGEIQHYVTLIADVSSLKQNEDKLRQIAHYDSLTGLPNRMLLTERLRHAVAVARRRKDVLAVFFLDLDGFKEINDTYGHAAGDELLVILGKRMQDTLRECDTVARLGGDEFVVLLPDLSERQDCEPALLRLLETLSSPVILEGNSVQVSASIGASLYPQTPDVDADILLRQADMAMYQAKQRGKNQYRFFCSISIETVDGRLKTLSP